MLTPTKWQPPRPLDQDADRQPYDLWYRGKTNAQYGGSKDGDTIFPALYVISLGLSAANDLNAFLEALSKTLDDVDEAYPGAVASRVTVHDFYHCIVDLIKKDPSDAPSGELVVFLGENVPPREFRRLLLLRLQDRFPDAGVVLAFVGPTIAAATVVRDKIFGQIADLLEAFVPAFSGAAINSGSSDREGVGPKNIGRDVLTVVIDHAIGFANSRFCNGRATRFLGFWTQQVGESSYEDPFSEGSSVGIEITAEQINGWLQDLGTTDLPNEVSLYRSAGLLDYPVPYQKRGVDPLRLSTGHGSQVLDIAAGDDPLVPIDFDFAKHGILAVQLPPELVSRTNGYLTELFVKSALNWVWFMKYMTGSANAKVIANLSFSSHSGRHDGQDILEADFERRMEKGEIDYFSLPAGNSFLSRTHAEFVAKDLTEWREMAFVVQPDGKDPVFLQLFCDGDVGQSGVLPIRLQLIAPDGGGSSGSQVQPGVSESTAGDEANIYYQLDRPRFLMPNSLTATRRTAITVAINPTNTLFHSRLKAAKPGMWRLRFKTAGTLPADSKVDIWIERGESLAGFPGRGRQAYFTDADYDLFRSDGRLNEEDTGPSPIRRLGTLNGFGSALSPSTIASIRASDRKASYFSSAASAGRRYNGQPSYGIFAEKSYARPNLLASGILSGGVTFAGGSSFASAHIARKAALLALQPSHRLIGDRLLEEVDQEDFHFAERYGHGTVRAGITPGRTIER